MTQRAYYNWENANGFRGQLHMNVSRWKKPSFYSSIIFQKKIIVKRSSIFSPNWGLSMCNILPGTIYKSSTMWSLKFYLIMLLCTGKYNYSKIYLTVSGEILMHFLMSRISFYILGAFIHREINAERKCTFICKCITLK